MGESREGEGRAEGPTSDQIAAEIREFWQARNLRIERLDVQPYIRDLWRVEVWSPDYEGSEVGYYRQGDVAAIMEESFPIRDDMGESGS